jgi:lysine biosynthesis protein LysW
MRYLRGNSISETALYMEVTAKVMILKCVDCGNTFRIEAVADDEIVTCPICKADYEVIIKDGKAHLKEFVYEGEDFGELP